MISSDMDKDMRGNLKLVLNDLYKFYMYFIASRNNPLYPASHLEPIIDEITQTILGEGQPKLCISMPPRHSKSSLISEALPFWRICQDKSLNIVIVTNTQVLAEKFGIALRQIIKEHGHLFNLYLSNVKHSNSHIMFEDAKGNLYPGSIRFMGSGGSLTGQDMDIILLDDPYKGLAEELTPTALQKKIDWYNQILLQRIEPQTRLIILHTRWVSNDLIGYLQENRPDDYKFLAYPALDEDNNPLWNERYSAELLMQRKDEMGDRLFNAIYQQEPLDADGDFFNVDRIHWHHPKEEIEASVRAWDIAAADQDNIDGDYSAGCFMQRTANGNAVITDIVHGKFGLSYTKDKVLETARRDSPFIKIVIETGVAGAGKLLFHEWEDQLKGYNVEQTVPIHAKEDRAVPLQNAIQDGKLYIAISDEKLKKELMKELYGFPIYEHDDIIDSMAHAYNHLFRQDEIDAHIDVAFLGGRINLGHSRPLI